MADLGRRFRVGTEGIDFFCECEAPDCVERLALTLDAFESSRAASEALLVDGHILAGAANARARAEDLVDSALALRAQSAHQQARAESNRQKLDDQ